MKKSELKTGMIVEFRSGLKSTVLLNTSAGDFIIGKGYETKIDEYTVENIEEWTNTAKVIRVFDPENEEDHREGGGEIVWERKIPEYTMEELKEKIGHEFKIKRHV